jgi:hypothetical protein
MDAMNVPFGFDVNVDEQEIAVPLEAEEFSRVRIVANQRDAGA